jgi:hypothetical protein
MRPPARLRRDSIRTLARRRDHLADLLHGYQGDPDYIRAELAALNYVLRILEAAEREDVLAELEMAAGLRSQLPRARAAAS